MLPELVTAIPLFIALGGVVTYLWAKMLPPRARRWTGSFTALWFLTAFGLFFLAIGGSAASQPSPVFPVLTASSLGIIIGLLATGVGALAAFASQGRIDPRGPVHLYYPLFLFAIAGTTVIGFTNDLFTMFVAVELSAIPSYTLVAYNYRQNPGALSAAIKYLVQGVAGTITALMGIALLYLAGHTLTISELPTALAATNPLIIGFAAILILLGYGVKLGIVPLHTWLPDTYVLAPSGVTAILTGATKIGVLVALFLSLSALPTSNGIPAFIGIVLCLLAILTMTAGNLLALVQPDLTRVLAYSSVAQMGYILLAFGIGLQYSLLLGIEAGMFFVIAYGIMKGGAFLAADQFVLSAGSRETARMKGLGKRDPAIGLSFTVFILGLIGIPLTAGFLGKLLVVQSGIAASTIFGTILVLILALNSAISLGYYVPILSTLLFQEDETAPVARCRAPLTVTLSVVILAIVTVYFGLFPQALFSMIAQFSGLLLPLGVP